MNFDFSGYETFAKDIILCLTSIGGTAAVYQLLGNLSRLGSAPKRTPEDVLGPDTVKSLLTMYAVVSGHDGYTDDERKRLLVWAVGRTTSELVGLTDGTLVALPKEKTFKIVRTKYALYSDGTESQKDLLEALYPLRRVKAETPYVPDVMCCPPAITVPRDVNPRNEFFATPQSNTPCPVDELSRGATVLQAARQSGKTASRTSSVATAAPSPARPLYGAGK